MKCTFPGCEQDATQIIKREGLKLPVCREHGPINVSEPPEPFRIELIEAKSKLARCERAEREAKLEYLRRDAERNRQLIEANKCLEVMTWEREQFIVYCQSLQLATGEVGPIEVARMHIERLVAERDTLRSKLAHARTEVERLTKGNDALVRQLGEFVIALKQSSGSAAIQITELTAELATLRATRDGAAIEAAAKECADEIDEPEVMGIIARHMRTLITTITKQ